MPGEELTVTIPLPDLRDLACRELERSFVDTPYRNDRGLGCALLTERVALAIRAYVAAYDFAADVAAVAPELVRRIVRDETATALRKAVRAELKAMEQSGEFGSLIKAVMKGTSDATR